MGCDAVLNNIREYVPNFDRAFLTLKNLLGASVMDERVLAFLVN